MTGFILFGVILAVLLGTIIWAAIRSGEDTGASLGAAERRDAAIEALRDLELEYRTGKLQEEEYRATRARLERTALDARDAAARGPAEAPAPEPRELPASPRPCPECAASLTGDEAFCPACGIDLVPRA
ncbi:MAG: hypothetical protein OXI39_01290 [Gemmatimonadota bacterium]|uniref:hypothetical protein n=1 Tax=Candidatus Palauibacter scopulicola TaxID=3056741 RepID=UPI00238A0F6D|nr:hypothetical protein [Candidatus Palauibacter scopulicola]MDE2661624.1 hypothetical protein [Candidatus Palauibacter scopulicola]